MSEINFIRLFGMMTIAFGSVLCVHFGMRIINGEEARRGQFPYIASLRFRNTLNELQHYCGGSIISQIWILTAAHCIQPLNDLKGNRTVESLLIIVVGAHHYTNDGQAYGVKKMLYHKHYDMNRSKNDIGLAQTNAIIQLSELVQIIPIRRNFVGTSNVKVLMSGWGSIKVRVRKFAYPFCR